MKAAAMLARQPQSLANHSWRLLHRDTQHLRLRSERETPIGLVTIEDAFEVEGAIFVGTLFHAQKLAMLPLTLNPGGGRLCAAHDNLLRPLLLLRTGGSKVHATIVTGDEKLIVAQLRNQSAAEGSAFPVAGPPGREPFHSPTDESREPERGGGSDQI